MTSTAVSIHGLGVAFGARPVLQDVDLTVAVGAALCLTGDNGAGKTTLLRCVTGLVEPDAGTVRVFGQRPDETATFWRRVATTVEQPSWYPGLTVREHVELVRLANGADPGDGRIDHLFTALGLHPLADSTPDTLSSGQRQRLLLAVVLSRPSELLVLDEPEQRLDAGIRQVVVGQLRDYLDTGGSILMASHDPTLVAAVGCPVLALDGAPTPTTSGAA
ncbi:ABC transporter ATP-binding protein [Micromonospora eburnea]|uniref:ABC transporter n=1 Tax=Micromonospora eburnea TaxID=227316 RepID=A0A1C6V9M1_9ACTN|nr:ABC transporter ATP-binding protein [Micromonospora eburnea]SCL63053.1 ABC transporter [Micromonospora eburnea]